MGVTAAFLEDQRRHGGGPAEHHLPARAARGRPIAVRSAFLEVREKVAKFVHEMRNAATGEISAICVLTGVSMDAQTRKSCPFPPTW